MSLIEPGKSVDKQENRGRMKSRMDNMDASIYILKIPSALHAKVKIKLVKEDRRLKAVLIEMLELYIKE